MLIFIFSVSIFLILLTLIVSLGLLIERRRASRSAYDQVDYNPLVSVLIPARNEAENLTALLNSFEKQSYRNFELILIDDRSEDNSLKIFNEFAVNSNIKVKVIANKEAPGENNPKVNVLLKGVELAEGELFLFTDADCCAGTNWVQLCVNAFADKNNGIVCGMLTLTSEDRFLCGFQNFDHFYRMLFAFGSIGLNIPIGCFGNNLAIRRETYDSTGGYEVLKHSATEDAELISMVKAGGRYKIRALFNEETFIETVHKKTWKEHANQASRWAAGAVFSSNRVAQLGFIALMLVSAFCLLSIFIGVFISNVFLIFPLIMYSYLFISGVALGLSGAVNRSYWRYLVPSVLLYPVVYVQSFLRTVITRTINWKGTVITWRKRT